MTSLEWIWVIAIASSLWAGDLYAIWTFHGIRKRINAIEARQRQVFLRLGLPFNERS